MKLTKQQAIKDLSRQYDRMFMMHPLYKYGWIYFFVWPIFNRSRKRRFDNLWDSGFWFDDCWRISNNR